jgi:hypothetical protein
MEKIRRGENVEDNRKVAELKGELVGRFLDLHAGCGEEDFF